MACVAYGFCGALAAQTIDSTDPAASAASTSADPLTPCQWRIAWINNPAAEATILWNTHAAGSKHRVTIRAADSQDERVVLAETERAAFLRDFHKPYFHHHAHINQLRPDTRYEVQLDSDGRLSRWFYFQTARSDGQPFSLIFGGDSRTGLTARKQMNQMIARMVEESWKSGDPADHIFALAHGGDYVFAGSDAAQWHQWLSDHESTTGPDGRLLPIIPARGNHDRGRLFAQAFGFDPADENYYGLSFGKLLRFVTLNTETSIAGDQAEWLDSELESSRSQHRWLVAQYHRPAYPAVKSPSGALAHWVPLFEQYNIDLACEADGHNIKRTVPIRCGTHDPTGVVYIGEGGMGVPQRTPKANRWFLQSPGFADRGHHVHLLRFTDEELRIECRLLKGETRDIYTRSPRGD